MDVMAQEEMLLYFFLCAASNHEGCSWWSTRQITKKLKIGPATLIRARKTLEERGLIATRQDEFSQRTIYQVLPLPIEVIREQIEIPRIKQVSKPAPGKGKATAKDSAEPEKDEIEVGLKYLEQISKKLNNT